MRKVALTGGIATGKSYVLERFRERGVACLDADALAHGVTGPGTEATQAIAARFGAILDEAGGVDRGKLGAIVFADAAARAALEAIVHPAVYRAIAAGMRAFELTGAGLVVVDIPLLFETGRHTDFDHVVVTFAPRDVQLARLKGRGLNDHEAEQRLAAQMPAERKAAQASFVIRTDGSFADTDRQVDQVIRAVLTPPPP